MKQKFSILSGIFILICITASNVNAQGWFVKFNAGYNSAFGSFPFISNNTETETSTGMKYKAEMVKFSLGKGINITLTPGYMLNKNFGVELGISYLIGLTTEAANVTNYLDGTKDKDVMAFKGSLISFAPSLVIDAGFKKIDPYSRFGFIIGIPSFTSEENISEQNGDVYNRIEKYSGGIALGVTGALGVKLPFSENFGAFLELAMNSLNYAPSKGVLTESKSNGVDMLPSMTTNQKETEFVDPYEHEYPSTQDPSQPSKSPKFKLPFSSLAVNFGVCMKF